MHILFITTHNFATNPRLVKEINLALANNIEATAIACSFEGWSKTINESIKKKFEGKISYVEVEGGRRPLLPWLLSSIYYLTARKIIGFTQRPATLSIASNKRSWLLIQALKTVKGRPDLVIAHNPGSFYPAWLYAQKAGIPLGIDLEDYHPGETNDPGEQNMFHELNKKLLPTAAYISAASPLILSYSKKGLPPLKKELLILNYFSTAEFSKPIAQKAPPLLLVWFSQNISHGRGLEEILPVVAKDPGVELHLYGNTDQAFCDRWLKNITNVVIHPAVSQEALHQELQKYDVGLALEKPESNLNRDLCITNKILAYYQAGLYILASKTAAQQEFAAQHKDIMHLASLDPAGMTSAIRQLIEMKEAIRQQAVHRYESAASDNWENESKKLLQTWKELTA